MPPWAVVFAVLGVTTDQLAQTRAISRFFAPLQDAVDQVGIQLSQTLISAGVPEVYAGDPLALLRMPFGLLVFVPAMFLAGFVKLTWRERFVLLLSVLMAFGTFGALYVLALGVAAVATFTYHELARTAMEFRVPRAVPAVFAGTLAARPAELLIERARWMQARIVPWQPITFLAVFWLIASAAVVYCFLFPPDWFQEMPRPIHYMHVAGFAFLYIKILSYSRDVLYGHLPERSLLHVLSWVFFHPTVRMGPIQRYAEFRDMVDHGANRRDQIPGETRGWRRWWHTLRATHVGRTHYLQGGWRLFLGCLKFTGVVTLQVQSHAWGEQGYAAFATIPEHQNTWIGFVHPEQLTTPALWLGALAQLARFYWFFSGTADLAIGLCHLAGYRLQENFDLPFIASSIADFWRRWHITLGAFCRNDIYIPLGGNRSWTVRNYFAVFVFIGLWHELGWTFAFWGALQAAGMAVHRWWRQGKESKFGVPPKHDIPPLRWRDLPGRLLAVLLTQAFVTLSFCALYDSQYGGLKFVETLIRRTLWLADEPALTTWILG